MSFISILTLEQRFCPINEIRKFAELVKSRSLTQNDLFVDLTIEDAVNKVIMKYPMSGSVNNLQDYFSEYFGCCLNTYCLSSDVKELGEIIQEEKTVNDIFSFSQFSLSDGHQDLKSRIYSFLKEKEDQGIIKNILNYYYIF